MRVSAVFSLDSGRFAARLNNLIKLGRKRTKKQAGAVRVVSSYEAYVSFKENSLLGATEMQREARIIKFRDIIVTNDQYMLLGKEDERIRTKG